MLSQVSLVFWLVELEWLWYSKFCCALIPLQLVVELLVDPLEIWNCFWNWWLEAESRCLLCIFLELLFFLSLLL